MLVLAWLIAAARVRLAWPVWVGAVGLLFVATLNAAAPVRGLVDPGYVGFSFGLLHAERGLAVTLLAGSLFLTAVVGAFAALSRERWAMMLTAAAAAGHGVNLGVPLMIGAVTDIEGNTIQLGEYLTIPGPLSTLLMFTLMLAPFVVALVRSAQKVLRPA